MSCQTASQRPCFVEGEVFTPAVGFKDQLRSGESLTGTPTVTEIDSSDLTITNAAVNTSEIDVDGITHAVGQAVQFKVSGQQASAVSYKLRIEAGTDATPAQTLRGFIEFVVVSAT